MRERLTARQTQLLEFLGSYIETAGYGPSVQEVCDFLRIRSKGAAHRHLRTLEDKGYILRKKNMARAIKVVRDGELLKATSEQPGVPFLAVRQMNDEEDNPWGRPSDRLPRAHRHIILDPALVHAPLESCITAVVGDDGMFPSGIRKGDLIVFAEHGGSPIPSGALVAVWTAGQLIIRELKVLGDTLSLSATARTYHSREIDPQQTDCRILGLVQLVLHTVPQVNT